MGCDWWGRVKGKGKGKGCRYMSCGEDKGLGLVGGVRGCTKKNEYTSWWGRVREGSGAEWDGKVKTVGYKVWFVQGYAAIAVTDGCRGGNLHWNGRRGGCVAGWSLVA